MNFIFRIILVNVFVCLAVLPTFTQKLSSPWLRVITQEDHVIDIDRSSLRFQKSSVVEVRIRTVLSSPESVPNQRSVKYATRIDSMHYDLKAKKYRILASSFLDSAGRSILDISSSDQEAWKSPIGVTGRQLMSAVNGLPPFGSWKVVTYGYGSGDPPSKDDPAELKDLVGSLIVLETSGMRIGRKSECMEPSFRSWETKDVEVQDRLGVSLKSFGFAEAKLDTVIIQCEKKGSSLSPSYVLLLSDNRTVLLWNGVFLELERVMMPFPPLAMN